MACCGSLSAATCSCWFMSCSSIALLSLSPFSDCISLFCRTFWGIACWFYWIDFVWRIVEILTESRSFKIMSYLVITTITVHDFVTFSGHCFGESHWYVRYVSMDERRSASTRQGSQYSQKVQCRILWWIFYRWIRTAAIKNINKYDDGQNRKVEMLYGGVGWICCRHKYSSVTSNYEKRAVKIRQMTKIKENYFQLSLGYFNLN